MVEILIKRSLTAGKVPTLLRTGEIAVNIPDKKMWIGDAAGTPVLISNSAGYLPLTGGTMTGTIVAPSGVNFMTVSATNFAIMGGGGGIAVRNGGTNLMLWGPTLTSSSNPIALPADPTAALHAATKQYVDNKLSTALLPTPTPTRLGGVFSGEATPGFTMYGIDTSGAPIFKQIAVPYPSATTLGGVLAAQGTDREVMLGVSTTGAPIFGNIPYPGGSTPGGVLATPGVTGYAIQSIKPDGTVGYIEVPSATPPYVLPPAKNATLGGIYANVPTINPGNEFVRGVDESGQLVFGNVVFPAAYVLPTASATVLGGVKVGTGLAIDANGVLSASGVSGAYLPLAGGTMTGYIVLHNNPAAAMHPATKGYVDSLSSGAVQKSGDAMTGLLTLSGNPATSMQATPKQYVDAFIADCVKKAGDTMTGLLTLSADPTAAMHAATKQYVDSKVTSGSFLPLAGGTMTGSIYLPTTVSSFSWGSGSYNIFGSPGGGVAIRNNATNLIIFTGANITCTVPMVTAGTGVGIQFGSGGATLSRGSAATKIAANGAIELPADPTAALEAATKQYVDSKTAGGSVTNPVAGSVSGITLWIGTQAQYDAIATKDAKTVYNITA